MKGFIIAHIDMSIANQSEALNEQIVRYTPMVIENEKDLETQFEQHFPTQTILMALPLETMRKNINILDNMVKQHNLVLDK